jgi:four helix bundle protein
MLRDFQAFQLAKEFHWGCKNLRISRFLQDQLLRASASVALNTAEGSGKRTAQDQRRFYSIALGSLRECEAILELEKINNPELFRILDRLGAVLFTLCRAPENRDRTATETATSNRNRD